MNVNIADVDFWSFRMGMMTMAEAWFVFRKTAKQSISTPSLSKVLFIALSGQSRTDRLG